MLPRHYSQPKYIQWTKNILVILAFGYPVYILLKSILGVTPIKALMEISLNIIMSFFMMMIILVGAHYFWQDIWVDEEGLQIEFLWRKIRVRWVDLIETKAVLGSWLAPEKNRPLIVLVNGLTPFHRIFGVLYGLSIKPGFVIYPSISDFQILKETIQLHARR